MTPHEEAIKLLEHLQDTATGIVDARRERDENWPRSLVDEGHYDKLRAIVTEAFDWAIRSVEDAARAEDAKEDQDTRLAAKRGMA